MCLETIELETNKKELREPKDSPISGVGYKIIACRHFDKDDCAGYNFSFQLDFPYQPQCARGGFGLSLEEKYHVPTYKRYRTLRTYGTNKLDNREKYYFLGFHSYANLEDALSSIHIVRNSFQLFRTHELAVFEVKLEGIHTIGIEMGRIILVSNYLTLKSSVTREQNPSLSRDHIRSFESLLSHPSFSVSV